MTRIWGVSALSHDASLAVLEDGRPLFAAHAERYSRLKNDPHLCNGLIQAALQFGRPDVIAWYERPLLKKARHLRAGQWRDAFTAADLPNRYLRSLDLPFTFSGIGHYAKHHDSHRAVGMATSGYNDAVAITADAIGEFATFTIAHCRLGQPDDVLTQVNYPNSLGLLYSAFTRRCGFRPNEDEYVVMGLASFGEPKHVPEIYNDFLVTAGPAFRLKLNPHRGIGNWLPDARREDLAASIQQVIEDVLVRAAEWARRQTGCRDLVFGGGLALNCVANTKIATAAGYDRVWIFPNPGDAGSSLGAAADAHGGPVTWDGPYLGTDIPGPYPVDSLLSGLLSDGMVGVASGRAEFGPRALGNRSILADPRPTNMQERVNAIKGREPFRPFAPVVRQERAAEFFSMPVSESPYMQFTSTCRAPDYLPAVTHVDGTSRVQTVTVDQHPGLYELLSRWEEATGCAVLLNTSLNGRSDPLVDTAQDARAFAEATGLVVR
ncbi:carbamoyltransferase C-terminal domain-containing protein [Nocardia salmonicida]|uniref:carbamoyltransferase C-terminal domain-containing protein n=1 Tax=Nocardia salmonicida TaxID=53431 RepID=UPI0033CDC08C